MHCRDVQEKSVTSGATQGKKNNNKKKNDSQKLLQIDHVSSFRKAVF